MSCDVAVTGHPGLTISRAQKVEKGFAECSLLVDIDFTDDAVLTEDARKLGGSDKRVVDGFGDSLGGMGDSRGVMGSSIQLATSSMTDKGFENRLV